MPIELEDLEDYWRDLRIRKVEITPEAEGPESVIDRAAEKLKAFLPKYLCDAHTNKRFTDPEELTAILVDCMRLFAHALYEEQRKQDISLLIQLFLEGTQNVEGDEVKTFMRNLPRPLINRILGRMEGSQSGLHAILSLEALFRDRSLERDYELRRDPEGKLVVTFYPKEVPDAVSFRLRELFESPTP